MGSILVGCGATGRAWVDEPESASTWSSAEVAHAARAHAAPAEPISASVDADASVENHQRLNHTVTLGEVDASATERAPEPGGAPSVSVTINNYGQSGYAPYGGYYSYGAFGARGSRGAGAGATRVTGASRSAAGMQAGQSWPSISDHGSSFPYRSSPVSPSGLIVPRQ